MNWLTRLFECPYKAEMRKKVESVFISGDKQILDNSRLVGFVTSKREGDFSLDDGCLKKGDMVVRYYLELSPVYKVSRIDGDKVFCSHHSNTKEYCFYHHHLRKAIKKEVETSIK